MWTVINIVIVLIGIALLAYGYHENRSENYDVIAYVFFGIVFVVISGVSAAIKAIWF